ncbi:efflux RND transporter periplasmic adaptor subunit [Halorhodospira halophila]|uniref:Efflux transporter, RND family, MFP subunit n=1 Tax=Halorhodospira halophila (strain DSM 244 / SL1) TaxID=349124 RepID=A1WYB8_HALHL|nr:efflux RND transporter periplasmic adaptor subunit [Halorhodospira halophila]ABM62680.1 efflux transporter, RND family, MFP subunit [Halorhodospira halophila SL1]MBK1728361.1 efflux RND transporter periplasmic adaptor subunit [Halorhodospira halophila]
MHPRWKPIIGWALTGLAVLGLLVLLLRPAPILVDTETVSRGPLEVTLEEEGKTRVADRYVLSAPAAAQARRITLEPGDRVEAGEVLATLDPMAVPVLDARARDQARAQLEAAHSALGAAREEAEAAQAAAESAADEYRRLAALGEEGVVAEREVERADAERRRALAGWRSAQFRVATAEAQRDQAEAVLRWEGEDALAPGDIEPIRLRAPIDGAILKRHFDSARVVQPGEPILEMADLGRLEVEVEVRSADAVRITPGMTVRLERWGDEAPLEAVVRRVEPYGFEYITALGVEERRVRVIADLASPREAWERLGDGYRVNAVFVLWSAEDVLRVPTSALFRHDDGWAVLVAEQGRARLRSVEIGERGARQTRLRSGLEDGEAVVVHPPRELGDGDRLEVRR